MARRLALAVSAEGEIAMGAARLSVPQAAALVLPRYFDQLILVVRWLGRSEVELLARAFVETVERGRGEDFRACALSQVERFLVPITEPMEPEGRAGQHVLQIESGRFLELVQRGEAGGVVGLGEAATPFERDRTGASTYVAIFHQVRQRWGYRCAFTGEAFPSTSIDSGLEVVAIHAREAGGPLHVDNYLPMSATVARAWREGRLSLGPGLDFLVTLNGLDPDLLERLDRSGRLLPPVDGSAGPDQRHLAWHRDHVLGTDR